MLKKCKVIILGALAALVIKVLYATVRWERLNAGSGHAGLPYGAAGGIFAFWHGRMLMLPGAYRRLRRGRAARPYMLISQHGDGRLIAFAIRLMGIHSVAGSSSRGGGRSLRTLLRLLTEGSDVGVTPDGPRGPARVCKQGVAILAQKSGAPVLPMTYSTRQRWQVRSWDGMIVPKPFSAGVVLVGDPIYVAPDEDLTAACIKIQEALNDLTARADRHWTPPMGV